MAQDYANKSKPRKGAVRRSPVSKAKKTTGVGKRRAFLSLLLVLVIAAMAYGLYQLARVKPDPQATQQQVHQQATEEKVAEKVPVSSSKAEEKTGDGYAFYDILPKSEVVPPEVPEYKSTPKSASSYSQYVLQAGSFKNPADADRLRAQLILMDLPNVTTSKVASASGSIWYRVRTGPFTNRSQLNKAQDQLVRMNLQPMEIKLSQ